VRYAQLQKIFWEKQISLEKMQKFSKKPNGNEKKS